MAANRALNITELLTMIVNEIQDTVDLVRASQVNGHFQDVARLTVRYQFLLFLRGIFERLVSDALRSVLRYVPSVLDWTGSLDL